MPARQLIVAFSDKELATARRTEYERYTARERASDRYLVQGFVLVKPDTILIFPAGYFDSELA